MEKTNDYKNGFNAAIEVLVEILDAATNRIYGSRMSIGDVLYDIKAEMLLKHYRA